MTTPPNPPDDQGGWPGGGYNPPPQGGGYGEQPPGGGYGEQPPGGGYGAPPPPPGGGYGPPPGGGYGAPPPPPGGGYGPPPPGGGYGAPPPGYGGQPQSQAPTILGIIGIVCWFCCSPAAIVLGLIGQSKAKQNGQSPTLPRIAWIGGIVFLLLGIILAIANASISANSSTY